MKAPILILIMIFSVVLIAELYIMAIKAWQKRQSSRETEYESLYSEIEGDLVSLGCSCKEGDIIQEKIKRLYSLKWKNDEKSNVLSNKYFKKYYPKFAEVWSKPNKDRSFKNVEIIN